MLRLSFEIFFLVGITSVVSLTWLTHKSPVVVHAHVFKLDGLEALAKPGITG